MTDTNFINRLATANAAEQSETRERGRQAGREWAKRKAKPRELERLDKMLRDPSRNISEHDAELDFVHLIRTGVAPNTANEQTVATRFWHGIGTANDDRNNVHFVRGFAEGAAALWRENKPQVLRALREAA